MTSGKFDPLPPFSPLMAILITPLSLVSQKLVPPLPPTCMMSLMNDPLIIVMVEY